MPSPRARRFAAARGFQPTAIVGSGPRGRVLERDVRQAYEAARPVVPEHGAASTLHSWADASGLIALRAQVTALTALGARVPDITIDDLVCFCVVRALVETPGLRAQIALRDAQTLSLVQLAARLRKLPAATTQPANGTVVADNVFEGTFAIGFGASGTEAVTPALTGPQVAALGVGAVHTKPLRGPDQTLSFLDAVALSLAWDHRAVDAAAASALLDAVKRKIEQIEFELILRGS